MFVFFAWALAFIKKNYKADSELDEEEDSDENVAHHDNNSGVDDGFFVGTRGDADSNTTNHHHNHNHDHNVPHENNPPFPYAPGFNPNVVSKRELNFNHRFESFFYKQ